MQPPSSTALRLRGAIFVLLALWMIGGPAYRQLLGGRSRIPRSWVMFTGFGVGEICDVSFTLHTAGGIEPIDRLGTLGYDDPWSAPARVRRVAKKKDAIRQGETICGRLEEAGTQSPDVRLSARCARRTGWHVVSQGRVNLCAK